MTTATSVPLTTSSPVRHRARRAGAALAAGSLLAAVLGLSAPASAATGARLVDAYASGGGHAYGSGGSTYGPGRSGGSRGSGGSGSTASSGTVDSEAATTAESTGVALIDTVLSDGEAAGTGIVLTSDGEVLTNYHVVEGSTSVKVTLPGSGGTAATTYSATVVGADQGADVALLQLRDARGLTTARIDDDTVALGDDVTAVGNAGGTGSLTAADGDVTDLSASITTQSEGSVGGESLTRLIETSADVVPGDSGGPLLDAEGEVVGIDTAASSGQDVDGYAVPIATALAIVTQIRSGDETSAVRIGPAAFLGVEVSSAAVEDSAYGNAFGNAYGSANPYGAGRGSGGSTATTGSGAAIAGAAIAGVVDGDAAAEAGLAAGDTITRVGSTTVSDAADLTTALAGMEPGDKVTVVWTTAEGEQQSATLTLDASPVN